MKLTNNSTDICVHIIYQVLLKSVLLAVLWKKKKKKSYHLAVAPVILKYSCRGDLDCLTMGRSCNKTEFC